MKKITLLCIISVFFSFLWMPEVIAKSYPMKCRGGKNIAVRLTTKVIYITFAKAKSHNNIKPCECAFIDRAIKPDEPHTLMLLGKNETVIDYGGGEVHSVTNSNKDFQTLWDAVTKGKEFIVYVENRDNKFIITKVGL